MVGGRPSDKDAAEHAEQAYQFHLRGKSQPAIAKEMGLSVSAVQKCLQRAFREHHPGPPEDERALENDRYAELLERLYTMLGTDFKKPPDNALFIMDRMLKAQAQRAVLLGLNKPVIVEDDLGDQLAATLKRVAQRYQKTGDSAADGDAAAEDA